MIWVIVSILCIALDRISKMLITANMFHGESIPLIKGVFHITYVRNSGAAFSILQGKTAFLVAFTVIIIVAALCYMFYKKPKNKLLLLSISLILSGAAGNLIDRIISGSVIDFLDFRLINFPVFNIADCCVVIGAALVLIYELKFADKAGESDGK